MMPLDMSIKADRKERDPLLSILNLGTLMSMISFNLERIMEKKNKEQEISSMLSGFLTSS